MQLMDWIIAEGHNIVWVADQIGRSYECVRRYCNGSRIPRKADLQKIGRLTDGKVAPSDFFGQSEEAA